MVFLPGKPKTGGRQKGIPNKATNLVLDILRGQNMNLVNEAVSLYHEGDNEFKLKVLNLLFPYCYHKKIEAPLDDSLDITPENEKEIAEETLKIIYNKFPQLNPVKDE